MKTTIEIPDLLMRDVKLRAVHEGRKLKDVVADLLRKGLDAPDVDRDVEKPHVTRDGETGLPIIKCEHAARTSLRLTPERVADILLEQEVSWLDEAPRH